MGLGYEQESSNSHSENKEFTMSTTFIKVEANKNNSNDNLMNEKKELASGTKSNILQSREHEEDLQNRMARKFTPRRQPRLRYQNFFNGYCLCCSNFGHKAANCDINFRNRHHRISSNYQILQHKLKQSVSNQKHYTPSTIRREIHDRNVNPFDLLVNEP